MTLTPIQPGRVDWSGENPGMYLRETPDGPYTCLASFFRVLYSPHGPGHAAFVLLEPGRPASPDRNFCLTDNPSLARYLKDEFVAHFSAFRGSPGLPDLAIRPANVFRPSGDPRSEWTEQAEGDGLRVAFRWAGLGDPYVVTLSADRSATGRHKMFSLFLDAQEADLTVNGERVPGRPAPRDSHGRAASTAFLAFAETWVRESD